MSGKVLKAGQAQAGDAVVLSARLLSHLDASGYADDPDAAELDPGLAEEDRELFEAKSQAQEIVDLASSQAHQTICAAQSQAKQILSEAQEQAAMLVQATTKELDAKREGLERGMRQELSAEYSARYLAAVTALESAAADLRAKQDDYLGQIEQPAYQLVLAIARQLIGGELSRAPQFIGALIAQAFLLLKPEQVAVVAVHPSIFHCLAGDDLLSEALNQAGIKPERVELEISENLSPGQFSMRINGMHLDYDLNAAIEELLLYLEQRGSQ